jgi:methionyl-tRNA formyltransferase
MRVAFFGSGSPISTAAFDAIAPRAELAAVVVPALPRGAGPRAWVRRAARRRARAPLAARARAARVPLLEMPPRASDAFARALAEARPDLVCVATFPRLIPEAVLAIAPLGALGVHPSLLPRRRGPDPLFWAFLDGDDATGVTVFRLDGRADCGPVVAQEPVALPAGRPGRLAYDAIARRGAALLARAVEDAAAGRLAARAQDEAAATRQPSPHSAAPHLDLAAVSAERLWRAARGIGPGRLVVRAAGGRTLVLGEARAHATVAAAPPGTLERVRGGWRLHCRDGFVEVAAAPWLGAARARLSGLLALAR